jgi:hypothetical protein
MLNELLPAVVKTPDSIVQDYINLCKTLESFNVNSTDIDLLKTSFRKLAEAIAYLYYFTEDKIIL